MQIIYTKHATKKFSDLKSFGIIVTKSKIKNTISKPKYKLDEDGVLIKAGEFDEKHNIRVIHRLIKRVIIVITFYIYRKGRYGEY